MLRYRNRSILHPVRVTALTLLFLTMQQLSCARKPQKVHQSFFRMDTFTEVTIVLKNGQDQAHIWNSVDSLLLNWEKRFSVTGEHSEVRVLNERTKPQLPVSPQLGAMLRFGLRYSDTLNQGFDLTILPIKEIWGFGEEATDSMPLPDSSQVDSALQHVSHTLVTLNSTADSISFASPTTRIDVGGIAKGFVLHELSHLLDRDSLTDYIISAGGDVVVKGKRPDKTAWTIGIQHPRKQGGLLGTLALDSGAVVTSGDYERFRLINGKRYHHLFNAHNGYCCLRNQSVTIWAIDPIEADVLSTGLFCREPAAIIAYVNARPRRFECMVVDSTGKLFISSGWRDKVELTEK